MYPAQVLRRAHVAQGVPQVQAEDTPGQVQHLCTENCQTGVLQHLSAMCEGERSVREVRLQTSRSACLRTLSTWVFRGTRLTACDNATQGVVQREKTADEERLEQQRMEYELRFMSERERRSTLRQRERENDKRLQRQLKFIARKEAEAAAAAAAGQPLDGRGGTVDDEDDWSHEAQPTDLASQQRVLITFYQVGITCDAESASDHPWNSFAASCAGG